MNPERTFVKDELKIGNVDVFIGHIDSVIEKLEKFKDDGWEFLELDYKNWISEYGPSYYISRTRIETDEEYQQRLEAIEKEKRRELYEQLKKEFEGD